MNKLLQNIEKRWQREGVKYRHIGKGIQWQKTLRTADCAFCELHEIERETDASFLNWGLLIHERDGTGRVPEVCPKCIKEISRDIIPPPRLAECPQCHVRQREKIYGMGFPGWSRILDFGPAREQREILRKLICPNCSLELAKKLGKKFIRATWTNLTYPAGSLLTSAKMTSNQANFAALGAGDSGAPDIYNLKSGVDASKSATPAVGDIYVATDTLLVYACYSAESWTIVGPVTDAVIKGWIQFNGSTMAIQDSFNVSSVAKNAEGDYTINWDTDFANNGYSLAGMARQDTTPSHVAHIVALHNSAGNPATGSVRIVTHRAYTESKYDSEVVVVIAIGDQ